MTMGMTPEQIYGQNVYVPATANPYPYGYTEVGSPTEWYNNQSSLGYDGQDIYFPGFQTEGTQCMYYAAPDNGSVHPSYSPYPINSSFIVDGSYLPLEYVGDAADQTCQIVPSPYYVPTILPYAHDNVLGNTTAPLHPPVYVPTLPSYTVTSTNHALPSVPPVATKNDIIANPPIQSTIVASKQFLDHASDPKVQLRNPIPLKKELADGSMMPVKYPHTSQAFSNFPERRSAAKHSPQEKFSVNNGSGFVGSNVQRWAAAEKFEPNSNLSGRIGSASPKMKLSNVDGLGGADKPCGQKSSAIIAKSYTSRLSVGDPEGTIVIRCNQYNSNDLRVDYPFAKFFVIKSIGEDDVHKSIKYGVWSSSSSGNSKLDIAFKDANRIAKRNSTKCPVFLFFSVNGSGLFCGMAEMVGPVDFHKDMDFWCQDKWTGSFPVRWHIVKDVPNYTLQHILLQNNENKPVTHSRDTQEIPYVPGISMLKILKAIKVKECLLDDFMKYEEDEARSKHYFRRSKLSHNAPDFVPVAQRRKDVTDVRQPKSGNVLIDRTPVIQNMSVKPQGSNAIKPQDQCLQVVEKQASDDGKENRHQENRNVRQANDKVVKTGTKQPQASTVKTSVDGKQQYWKKVEFPRQNPNSAVHGSSKAHEKHLNESKAPEKHSNGANCSSGTVSLKTAREETIVARVSSLAISSQNSSVDVVKIGSMPVLVNKANV
uniref:YTH domain-containing family protein n=1 Tax=Oryza nivara TaxID=4536 RepID=A0A0E0HNA9_ORYNI